MHLYLYFNEKFLKPCKMFIYVCMYVCMFACVYNFHTGIRAYPVIRAIATAACGPSENTSCVRTGDDLF